VWENLQWEARVKSRDFPPRLASLLKKLGRYYRRKRSRRPLIGLAPLFIKVFSETILAYLDLKTRICPSARSTFRERRNKNQARAL
jgi:hypothetical protein